MHFVCWIVISKAIDTFKRMLISWQKSDFNLVKIHVMSHYVDSICRFRTPFEDCANLYEHLHITLMKTSYCGSNCCDYIRSILKHN